MDGAFDIWYVNYHLTNDDAGLIAEQLKTPVW